MLTWWNSCDVVPGWALVEQQRRSKIKARQERFSVAKACALAFGISLLLAWVAR